MTRKPLDAPEAFKGRMTKHSPQLDDRNEWINARALEGYRGTEIAAALGIHPTMVNRVITERPPAYWDSAYIRRNYQVKVGSVYRVLARMAEEDRKDLLRSARDDNGDIVDFLITHWLKTS